MNIAERVTQTDEGIGIRRPLASEWMTVPLGFRHTGFGTSVVNLEVYVANNVSIIMHVAVDNLVRDEIMKTGRTRYWFIHQAIMTPEGPATKIDKMEVSGVPLRVREGSF